MNDDTNDLRAALATLTNDLHVAPGLVELGVHRGRRLRTRRRVTAVAAAAGSVALLVGVAGLVGGGEAATPPANGVPTVVPSVGSTFTPPSLPSRGTTKTEADVVVYRSTGTPAFTVTAHQTQSANNVCFGVTGPSLPDPPRDFTCWYAPTTTTNGGITAEVLPHSTQSLSLGNGWSVAVDGAQGDVSHMLFVPPGAGDPIEYVPAAALPDGRSREWKFSFAAFRGSEDLRGTFIPVQPTACTDANRDARRYGVPPGTPVRSTPEAALAALVGAPAQSGPGLPPKSGYHRLPQTDDPGFFTFAHDDGYQVDLVKVGEDQWAGGWIGRCT